MYCQRVAALHNVAEVLLCVCSFLYFYSAFRKVQLLSFTFLSFTPAHNDGGSTSQHQLANQHFRYWLSCCWHPCPLFLFRRHWVFSFASTLPVCQNCILATCYLKFVRWSLITCDACEGRDMAGASPPCHTVNDARGALTISEQFCFDSTHTIRMTETWRTVTAVPFLSQDQAPTAKSFFH